MRCQTCNFNVHCFIVGGADNTALERSHGANWGKISVAVVVVVVGGGGGWWFGEVDGGGAMEERGGES